MLNFKIKQKEIECTEKEKEILVAIEAMKINLKSLTDDLQAVRLEALVEQFPDLEGIEPECGEKRGAYNVWDRTLRIH